MLHWARNWHVLGHRDDVIDSFHDRHGHSVVHGVLDRDRHWHLVVMVDVVDDGHLVVVVHVLHVGVVVMDVVHRLVVDVMHVVV